MTNRQPKDFNYQKPDDKQITDPVGANALSTGQPLSAEYPKHVHKFAGEGNAYEWVEVTNVDEEATQRANGFKSAQEVDAEQAAKKADAKKKK